MRLVALALLQLVLALPASMGLAQSIEVRSGAHAGYSRVVVEFPAAPNWRLDRLESGYLLRTDARAVEFDTSQVFQRIPGTRLSNIRQQEGTGNLALSLACDCTVSAFELARGAVVIDVQDARTPEAQEATVVSDSGALRSSPRPRERPAAQEIRLAELFDGPVQLLRGSVGEDAIVVDLPEPDNVPASAADAKLGVPFRDSAPQLSPVAELLTRSLAREIARAATQGLVETRRSGQLVAEEAMGTVVDAPNIRIETAHDRVFGPPADLAELSASNDPCRPSREFDVGSWGDGRPAADQIAAARRGLVGELHVLDGAAVAHLVRLYIHLSFGEEAARILNDLGSEVPDADILGEFAALMEGDLRQQGILSGQISCGGAAALWAVLALPKLPSNEVIDKDAVLLAFSGLPAHLRRHLGPRLASRFASANDVASVEAISNSVGRIVPTTDPAYALTQGQLAIADTGRPTGADAALEEIAAGRHPGAPDALLLLINGYAERNAVVPLDIIDTADIMTFELAGTDLGSALKAATIRARLTRGEYREAFQGLVAALEDRPPDTIVALESEALTALVRNSDEAVFLRRILDPAGARMALRADSSLRFELAQRLLDMGFPVEANRLASPDTEATVPEVLDYSARLSLALGSPGRAVEFARRSSTSDSVGIEADGLAKAGRFGDAADLFLQMGDQQASLQMSWRAGDWARISADSEGPERAAAIALMEADTIEPFPSPPSLAAAQERLGASADLRKTLEAVFAENPSPAR